jgi:hypothetical protein
MLNDNKTEVKISIWSRKFGENPEKIQEILSKLEELSLIKITHKRLFIPSCEPRLQLKRGGSNGGKKSKPNSKPIDKPILKPTPNQIEIEKEIKKKSEFKNRVCKHYSISYDEFDRQVDVFSISNDMDRELKDVQKHFFNWLKHQELHNDKPQSINPSYPVN